jgi:hypothetical protein
MNEDRRFEQPTLSPDEAERARRERPTVPPPSRGPGPMGDRRPRLSPTKVVVPDSKAFHV